MRRAICGLMICVSVLWGAAVGAAEHGSVRAFFFGNSLVQHPSDTEETSTVYWLGYVAKAAGKELSADGTWGFLRNFGDKLPPKPEWTVPGVQSAWKGALGPSGYDAVVLTPTNFIQYQAPELAYEWDNPKNLTPLSASKLVLDAVHAEAPDARLFIYEGWADMAGVIKGFPPNSRRLARYHRFNTDDYHDWYVDYTQALAQEYPQAQVRLIPVASVLGKIFADPSLKGLKATDLYTDDAPHGTPTLYFLASLVTYAALYDIAPPAALVLPPSVHPLVRANYGIIAQHVAQMTGTRRAALSSSDTAIVRQPALAMGLDGIHDWSTQYPFLDVMKSARPWLGHLRGKYGGFEPEQLEDEGYLDEHGWPMEIPEGVEKLESYMLTDLPREAQYFTGRYRLTYDGQGILRVGGRARNVRYSPGEVTFTFEPGDGPVAVAIQKTEPADHIRNIAIVHEDHVDLFDMGVTFNPRWVSLIRDLRVVRFMDWMITNGSFVSDWRERPTPQDYTFNRRGVPVEVMVKLANQIGADPWFNMPHAADDAYVEAFATYVRDNLDPRRKAYVEYSNEMWNFLFEQTRWAMEQARNRWNGAEGDAWMQWTGMRAAQVMQVWTDVFGGTDRLVRVIGVHTGWPGLEDPLFEAPLYMAEDPSHRRPADMFDAYAVTGYFGIDGDDADMPDRILRWAKQGVVTEKLTDYLRTGPLKDLTENVFPYHAKVAKRYGMQMIMYEGGTHIVGLNEWVDNEELTQIYTAYNYSVQVGSLYQDLLSGWQAAGGVLFNGFVDVAKPSKWGSWGAKRHLADESPRWDALMAYNANGPSDWEQRPADAFDDGVFLPGSDADQELIGTKWVDVILGRGGNDRIIASGGADFLHGGDGMDTAVLPGKAADYALALWGDTWLATGPDGEIALREIETLEFQAEPGQQIDLRL
ncbi:calcium-binding protein [Thalassovita sp.]|uniref:calcium-binding protein n=1 Tax=Thalassovita sp. TaxID=1979401 RepID=UPI0028814EF9|nr:calcium-binding protein [Thalassovita sp.]MDF1802047.1 calcium-binding protein [Thalassovita sp.]